MSRPRVTVHYPYDRSYETYELPQRFRTVAQAVTEARVNGATAHPADEPCTYCTNGTDRGGGS